MWCLATRRRDYLDLMGFQVTAEAYDRFMGRFSQPLAERLVQQAGIRPGMRVLDVGSGPGALSRALVDVVGAEMVAAVDPEPVFVEALRTRLPGVPAAEGRAENLPHGDATFDGALACLVVHFMADPAAGLREMARVTRPGGVVAATVWQFGTHSTPLSPFWEAATRLDPDAPDESERAGTTDGALVRLLAEAGVPGAEQSELTVTVGLGSFEEYWEPFTLGVGPAGDYLQAQTPERKDAIHDLAAELLGPSLTLTGTAWCAVGVRP